MNTKLRLSHGLLIFFLWFFLSSFQSHSQQSTLPQQKPISSVQNPLPAAPAPFGKGLPPNGAPDQPVNNLVLTWGASSSNVNYQYCVRLNKLGCPPSKWITVGANRSVTLQGLTTNTQYFWQVRAVDASNNATFADDGLWWSFTTVQIANLPGPFGKLAPPDAQANTPMDNLTLSWGASSLATSYQYCVDTVNNNTCDTTWASLDGLSVVVSGLLSDQIYYWQVRAVNASGSVQGDYGTWWSFHTQVVPPGPFDKTSPANFAVEQPLSLTLHWTQSSGSNVNYDYCLGLVPCTDASTWIHAGTNVTVTVSGLQYETTYYWQVRAFNSATTLYANNGASWSFSTQLAPPGGFSKSAPGNNLPNQPLSLELKWTASTGTNIHYEYCLDTTTCTPASIWLSAGSNITTTVSGLSYGTPYFWQVRAVNVTGATYADGGAVWQFTTQVAPPDTFDKLSPGSAGPTWVPTNVTLQWSQSTGASEYFYCVDTASHPKDDLTCSTGWVLSTTTTSNHLNLKYDNTYYWQVYAQNSQGTSLANGGVWWSFTTFTQVPFEFTKMYPLNAVVDQPLKPWLYWWTPSYPGTTYAYCIDLAVDCPGNVWMAIGENTPITITTALAHATTYYWQVRATNPLTTYANGGAWWSFTTLKDPPTSGPQSFDTLENTTISATLTASSNYGKVFTLSGSLPPGGLDFHSDGYFRYTPQPFFEGSVSFAFKVSDGYNPPVGPFTVTIHVLHVNEPPALSPIPDQVVKNGALLTFWAQATDTDIPYGDALTYSVDEPLPVGASIDSKTGLFSWAVPANQAAGVHTYTVRVTDNGGLSAARTVKITVDATYILRLPLIYR